MLTRRAFLGTGAGVGVTFVSLGGAVPALFAQAAAESAKADQNDRILVVVELAGGNDGLNTLIPFEDARYYKNRRTLGIPKGEVLQLSKQVGLHPKMTALSELFKGGRVAVVQGAGYPEPDRSHFRSMEIWHTASVDKTPPTSGWLGRYVDAIPPAGASHAIPGLALTGSLPQAFQAENAVIPVVSQLDGFKEEEGGKVAESKLRRKLSTVTSSAGNPISFMRHQAEATYRTADLLKEAASKYKSSVQYPEGSLGDQLRRAAQIISGDLGARVLFTSQDGYDTHSEQGAAHGELLGTLSQALAAFDKDMNALGFADRVVVMVFSEFGRRVDENASRGTDHGAASCMFLVGSKVKGGLVGQYPSLEKLGEGDLIFNTDFRSVYATILDRWLGCPAQKVLGRTFPMLDLLNAPA